MAPCERSSSGPPPISHPFLFPRQVEYARPLTEAEEAEVVQGEECKKQVPHCTLCLTPYGSDTPLCFACEPPYMADGRGGYCLPWTQKHAHCICLFGQR